MARGANLAYAADHAAYQHWKWPKIFRQHGQEPANAQDQADLDFTPNLGRPEAIESTAGREIGTQNCEGQQESESAG